MTEDEKAFRDNIESIQIKIPLYPVQNRKGIKVIFDVQLKPCGFKEEIETEELVISRYSLFNIFGSVIVKDMCSTLNTFVRTKFAIRKLMKELDGGK